MKPEPKRLGPNDPPPWNNIRRPWARLDPDFYHRYLREELGEAMCSSGLDCVVVRCPVESVEDAHDLTICRRGACDNVTIKCAAGHTSKEVIEAIIDEL